jgi:hypothetical protein
MEWDNLETEKRRMIKKHCNGKHNRAPSCMNRCFLRCSRPQIWALNSHFFLSGAHCKQDYISENFYCYHVQQQPEYLSHN